jgi:cell division protease FtsH
MSRNIIEKIRIFIGSFRGFKKSDSSRIKLKSIAYLAAVAAIAAAAVFAGSKSEAKYAPYNEFIDAVSAGEVSGAIINDGPRLTFSKNGDDATYESDNPRSPEFKLYLLENGVSVTEGRYVSPESVAQNIIGALFFCAAGAMAFKIIPKRRAKTSEMETKQVPAEAASFRFEDVAGADEAKESVADIVDFIGAPEKYVRYGARMPKGVIFYGPPGTGKTLMAKAIAGEAGAPFYAVTGSDFVHMYVGVGAERVRSLFKKAREHGRAVIFIDEIDALGKKRSAGGGGGSDERDQTLNALLTEMSGFSGSEGIVVVAATNRLDTLDEALLRPGRFDRQIEIGLPDFVGREKILSLHAKNKPVSPDVSIRELARQTAYFSGAMLENLLNEAAISAAKKGGGAIGASDLDSAYYTIIAGAEKKNKSCVKEKERRITAFHEAGHALAAKYLSPDSVVAKITIIPSVRGAGGFCVTIPPEKAYLTRRELESQAIISLAGRAAEEIIFGEENITTGASNDIEKATRIVSDLITKYGMSSAVGLVNTHTGGLNADGVVFAECKALTDRLYNEAKQLLSDNLLKLKAVAEELLSKETLSGADLDRLAA